MLQRYSGIISVTKDIGHHLFIETNMNISGEEREMTCKLFDIPLNIKVENYRYTYYIVITVQYFWYIVGI